MTLDEITRTAIDPALAWLPAKMNTIEARAELLTIGLQESRMLHRRQLVGNPPAPIGPAKGFWQFENGTAASRGGVWGVFLHSATNRLLRDLAESRGCAPSPTNIWNAIEQDDVLAAGLARLLLWTEPGSLPRVADTEAAWQLYLRAWRPGAYTRGTPAKRAQLRAEWEGHHRVVRAFLGLS